MDAAVVAAPTTWPKALMAAAALEFPPRVPRSVITPFCQRNAWVRASPDHLTGIVDVLGVSALDPAEGAEVGHRVGTRRSGCSLPVHRDRGKEDEREGRGSSRAP